MTKTEKTKLMKKLEEAKKAHKTTMEEKLEVLKVEAEIKRMSSPIMLKIELGEANNQKLDVILDYLETDILATIRPVYGYGSLVNKLFTIGRTIQYSKMDIRQEALALVGGKESLIEDMLDALGNTSYYSKENKVIIEAIECDEDRCSELLELFSIECGLVGADISKFNYRNIKYNYANAKARATQLYLNSQELEDMKEEVEYND